MTGRIIPLRGDPHERVQSLLPWFVTGKLDPAEKAEVETHLAACSHCRIEERLERRLATQLADMPITVEQGWARLRERLDRASPGGESHKGAGPIAAWRDSRRALRRSRGPGWLVWAIAAQVVLLAALLGLGWSSARLGDGGEARYHTLGAPGPGAIPPGAGGDAVVMFRPDTPERTLRGDLEAGQARLVDGPTSAGAYVLWIPTARRAAALAAWRGRPEIVLAEPIDEDPSHDQPVHASGVP